MNPFATDTLKKRLAELGQILAPHGSALVAFSGGVDLARPRRRSEGFAERQGPGCYIEQRDLSSFGVGSRAGVRRISRGGAPRRKYPRARQPGLREQPHEPLLLLQEHALLGPGQARRTERCIPASLTGRTRTTRVTTVRAEEPPERSGSSPCSRRPGCPRPRSGALGTGRRRGTSRLSRACRAVSRRRGRSHPSSPRSRAPRSLCAGRLCRSVSGTTGR